MSRSPNLHLNEKIAIVNKSDFYLGSDLKMCCKLFQNDNFLCFDVIDKLL